MSGLEQHLTFTHEEWETITAKAAAVDTIREADALRRAGWHPVAAGLEIESRMGHLSDYQRVIVAQIIEDVMDIKRDLIEQAKEG